MYKNFGILMLTVVVLFAGCRGEREYHTSSGMANPLPAGVTPGQALKNLDYIPLTNGEWVMLVAWNRDGTGINIPARVDIDGNLLPDGDYYALLDPLKWQRNGCAPAFRHESKLFTALIVMEAGAQNRLQLSDLLEVKVKPGETDAQALCRYWRQPNAADSAPGGK
jgi:hypothetical protein